MQALAMFSVPCSSGTLCAVVPERTFAAALIRLRADDPLWLHRAVYFHGWHHVDDSLCRVRMRNKIKFFMKPAPGGSRQSL